MNDQIKRRVYGLFPGEYLESGKAAVNTFGGTAFVLPAVRFERTAADTPGVDILRDLASFGWLIFTGTPSVDHFNILLKEQGIELSVLDQTRICAIDDETALRLRDLFVHADLVPWSPTADEAAAAIRDFDPDELTDRPVLVVRSENDIWHFAEALEKEGAAVYELAVYRPSVSADSAKARALLLGGGLDALIVSSREDISALHELFPKAPIPSLLNGIEVLAVNEVIYDHLHAIGVRCRMLPDPGKNRESPADA